MDHPKAVCDEAVRLQTLTVRLTAHIVEARDVRARLVQALEANAWPDVRVTLQDPPPDDRRRD